MTEFSERHGYARISGSVCLNVLGSRVSLFSIFFRITVYLQFHICHSDYHIAKRLGYMVLKIGVFVNYAIGLIAYLTTGAFAVHIIKPSVKALLGNSVMSADLYKMENA